MSQFKLPADADTHVSAEKEQEPSSEVFATEQTGENRESNHPLAGNSVVTPPLSAELHFPTDGINFAAATPQKRRRGRCMSRRRGQTGSISINGNWWTVRFWKDVPGQEKRTYLREKICTISGPGLLTASARKRTAKEIIFASGADKVETLQESIASVNSPKFRQQSEAWLAQ